VKNIFLNLVLTLVFVGIILVAYGATDFSAANKIYADKLYAEGKFADAATAYERILQADAISSPLLFNYGNAEFKSGHLGKAIAAYQRAAQLSPRDAEIRANLAFASNQVQGAMLRAGRWQNALGTLTLNEWTVFVTVAFWLTFLLLAAKQIRPALQTKLRGLTFTVAAITFLSGAALGVQAANHFSNATAVVVVDNVTARSGPFDDAQSAFTARDGAELSVLDQRDGWVQVTGGAGKSGWLPAKQVEIVPGA
jgi:tetratricopeptide (TPR) repeat protein